MVGDLPHLTVDVDRERLLPWDGHPDERGAAQIADAIAAALGYNAAP